MMAKMMWEAELIDLNSWEPTTLFEFFKDFTEPFHGVCLRVDCSESFGSRKILSSQYS
jgi:hypothetical protein